MTPVRAAKIARSIGQLHKALEPTDLFLERAGDIVRHCAPAHLRGLVPAIRGAMLLSPPPPPGAAELADACELFVRDHPRWSALLALPYATRDPLARFLAIDDRRLPLAARGLLAERLRFLRAEPRGAGDPTLSGYSLGVAAQYLATDGHAVELLEIGDYAGACDAVGFTGLRRSTAHAYRAALRQAFDLGTQQRLPADAGATGHSSSPGSRRDCRALLEALLAADASPGAHSSKKGGGAGAPGQPWGLTTLAAMRIPRGVRACPPHVVASVTTAVRATDAPRPVRELLAEVLLATYLTGWPPAVFEAIGEGKVAMDPVHGHGDTRQFALPTRGRSARAARQAPCGSSPGKVAPESRHRKGHGPGSSRPSSPPAWLRCGHDPRGRQSGRAPSCLAPRPARGGLVPGAPIVDLKSPGPGHHRLGPRVSTSVLLRRIYTRGRSAQPPGGNVRTGEPDLEEQATPWIRTPASGMNCGREARERAGSPRVPAEQVLADCLDGLRDAACSATSNTADGWNVWVAGAAYATAVGTGLRPQELVRVRAQDVSLRFGTVTVSAPKVGAPRLVPLGPALLAWLDPLVDALSRTRQYQTPCLCLWQDDRLVLPTPVGLQALARRILGPGATVPALGQLRHEHLTWREHTAHDAEGTVGDPEADRWRSALCGHGQTGGWSVYLPQRFARAHRQLCAEQQQWLQPPPPLLTGPFEPPRLTIPIDDAGDRPIPQARSAKDWVLAGVRSDSFPLDYMGPARTAIWDAASQLCEGSDRAAVLAGLAAVEMVGFGDLLCSDWLPRLQRLQWPDWQPNAKGVWLRFGEHSGPPPLRVWGTSTVRMIGEALHQLGEPSPFGSLDQAHVRQLLQIGAGLRGSNPMQSLQQANVVLHLVSHANDEIGYLAGRVERLVIADTAPPTRHRRLVLDHGLGKLRSRLQHFDGRVTQEAFDRLVKESCPSLDYTSSALQPVGGRIVASLRLIYRNRRRSGSQRLRSRSPHTLLARLTDLCLIATAQEASDHGEDPENWGPSPTGSTRRRAAAALWEAYHRRAKLPFTAGLSQGTGRRARVAPLATWAQIDSAIRSAPLGERPALALYAALATRLRAAELSRVQVKDIVVNDQDSISVWVTHSKGGRSRWTVVDGIAPHVNWVSGAASLVSDLAADDLVFGSLVSGEVNPRRLAAQVQRRFLRAGCQWHAHMMRTLWSTTADRSGIDRATISIGLAHVLVRTVTTNYVALDETGLLSAAAQLSALTAANVVSVAHVAAIRGVGRRQAERDHARLMTDLTWSDSAALTPQEPGELLHLR